MPITILTGMPGAGESKPLITTVNHARELGRVTLPLWRAAGVDCILGQAERDDPYVI